MKELYKVKSDSDRGVTVFCDTGELKVHKRSGKNSFFVCWKGEQININAIPILDTQTYPVYWNYVFGGGTTNAWINYVLKNHARLAF